MKRQPAEELRLGRKPSAFRPGRMSKIPDEEVLEFAVNNGRAVLTRNRRDFIRLHIANSNHEGIIVCTEDSNFVGVANRIHGTISTTESLKNKLIRINRSS